MLPTVAVRNEVHGPEAEEPTCFNRLIAGAGVLTSTSVVDVLPVPPLVEETVTELFFNPAVDPVTLTVSVQETPAARLTPVKLMEVEPGVAVAEPPQVFDKPLGLVTARPVCAPPNVRSSVKLTPVRVVAVFGFVIVKVNAVEFPTKIGFEVKALLMTGGAITVIVSCAKPTLAVVLVLGPDSVAEMFVLVLV